jgi:membrane-bound lytic murein transglycosylase D
MPDPLQSTHPLQSSQENSEESRLTTVPPAGQVESGEINLQSDDKMPVHEPDLWQRVREGFSLNHELDRRRVQQEISWYQKHPEYIDRVAARASKHLYHIVEELEKNNIPLEIALLPIVESAYDPFAYSHGRASGLWQFIPSTARLYGLKIDWWYDGRRDVKDSTQAAIDYLKKLHTLFNDDWYLALAAYNSGQGNIGHSIRKNQRAGKPVDFWSLDVPRETRSYVPRLLAISEVIANPEKYNIKLKEIPNVTYWVEVDISSQLDLAKAAELANLSNKELYQLNPGFNQWSTHPDGPHRLLLPLDTAPVFTSGLAALPKTQRLAWTRHKIKNGESLGTIASRYHTTVGTIKTANDLSSNMIRAGDYLSIPMASKSVKYEMTSTARLKNNQNYLEKKYGTEPVHYTVKAGDSFWKISRKFGVGTRQVAKWNGMGTTQLLRPGMELLIFNTSVDKLAQNELPVQKLMRQDVVRKVNYRVRKGESLSLIANKFNLSVNNIEQWNEELDSSKYIQPGDKITLYVDVTGTE